MASYVGQINYNSSDLPITSTLYGTCNTSSATAEKVVTCANFDKLISGVTLRVYFTSVNTAPNPTLNVNNTGAKNIYWTQSVQAKANSAFSWTTGEVVDFYYNGTVWIIIKAHTTALVMIKNTTYGNLSTYQMISDAQVNSIPMYLRVDSTGDFTYLPFIRVAQTSEGTTTYTRYYFIGHKDASTIISCYFEYKTGSVTSYSWSTPVTTTLTTASANAASGGTDLSLVTTGEKYTWNNKSNLAIGTTATTAAAGNHTHGLSIATDSGTNQLTMAANTKYKLTAGGSTYIFTTPPDGTTDANAMHKGTDYVTAGQKSGTTLGTSATAEGDNTTVSGDYSHAEGYFTKATGTMSHAEGQTSTASALTAHAEGNNTTASETAAHSEGNYTTASGVAAHAEGYYTTASGYYSHAEGYYTTAASDKSHVIGQYNIVDNNSTYVEIVGNGTSNSRSNARTLDWSGNEVLAGKLTVGAGPTNSMDVATKGYVTGLFSLSGTTLTITTT